MMTVLLTAMSFFLLAKFHAYWCRHVKVTADDTVGRFFETSCTAVFVISSDRQRRRPSTKSRSRATWAAVICN